MPDITLQSLGQDGGSDARLYPMASAGVINNIYLGFAHKASNLMIGVLNAGNPGLNVLDPVVGSSIYLGFAHQASNLMIGLINQGNPGLNVSDPVTTSSIYLSRAHIASNLLIGSIVSGNPLLNTADPAKAGTSIYLTFAYGLDVLNKNLTTTVRGKNVYGVDAVTVSDLPKTARSSSTTVSDSLNIIQPYVYDIKFEQNDSNITDKLSEASSYVRKPADVLTVLDTLVRSTNTSRSLADVLTVLDTLVRSTNTNRKPADVLTVLDTLVRSTNTSRKLADTLTALDTLIRSTSTNRVVGDAVTTVDVVRLSMGYLRHVADSVVTSDTINAFIIFIFNLMLSSLGISSYNIDILTREFLYTRIYGTVSKQQKLYGSVDKLVTIKKKIS